MPRADRRGLRSAAWAMAVAALAAGCARGAQLPRGPDEPGRFAEGPPACDLLTIEEVEVAVNEAVAETPGRARPVLPGMAMCALARSRGDAEPSAADQRAAAAWGVLDSSASRAFSAYRSWHGDHLTLLEVAGHRGLWDRRLRTLVVLAGERAFGIRLTASRPVLDAGAGRDAYFRGVAAQLAEAALGRLP